MATDLSICRHCGAEVMWRKWARTGRTAPPIVSAGDVMALDEHGQIVIVQVFVRHKCDHDQMQRWEAQKAREAAQKAAQVDHAARAAQIATERGEKQAELLLVERAAYTDMREEAYRRAAKVDCPKCPAREAEECLNLNYLAGRRHKNDKKHTSWPHPERVLLAEREGY